jgi:hypothetical protein
MKCFFSLSLIFIPLLGTSQLKDTTKQPIVKQPEIFTSGFIDIINNGQVNASARFIRLYIGEPGKLAVPISLYTGVSSNNFQNTSSRILPDIHTNGIYHVINCMGN